MEGYYSYAVPGYPDLPSKIYRIAVPPDIDLHSIEVEYFCGGVVSFGSFQIREIPPLVTWVDGIQIVGKKADVYLKDSYYPEKVVEYLGFSQMRKWRIVNIKYNPFQYNPVTKDLRYVPEVTLSIRYSKPRWRITSSLELTDKVMDKKAKEVLINYEEAEEWYTSGKVISSTSQSQTYNYVVITTNHIDTNSTKLTDFITYLAGKGYSPLVITEDDYGSLEGQSPNGTAEKIREWLKNNYMTYSIEYVLLIGNPDPAGDVPMKMCWPRYDESSYREAPTDYFYADLTGNWDLDGDGYFGEYPDDQGIGGVDFANEIYVGRIPVYSGVSDLDSVLSKTITYGNANNISWRSNALLPMSFSDSSTDGAYLGEAMKSDYLSPSDYSSWTLYMQGSLCLEADSSFISDEELLDGVVKTNWMNNPYGMVWWWGHGNTTKAYLGYNGCGWGTIMISSDAQSLNDNYPSFVYQCSCSNGYPEVSNNLGTALLYNGAIATVSASRISWYAVTSWFTGLKYYCDNASIGYYYGQELVSNDKRAAVALYDIKSDMGINGGWWGGESWMNLFDFNLYGNPETSLSDKHTVFIPDMPDGPPEGMTDIPYTYTTGGSFCSQGHSVEYRFDWGDGTYSDWSSSTSASHSWSVANTYIVKSQARCSINHSILSEWSSGITIFIQRVVTTQTISGYIRTLNNEGIEDVSMSYSSEPGSLDQKQEDSDYGFWFENGIERWQEFRPAKNKLARIEILVRRDGNPGNIILSIKDINGQYLWGGSIDISQISQGVNWISVSIEPNLILTPEEVYKIHVTSSIESPDPQNRYFWKGKLDSPYTRGISDVESSWPGFDYAFRTYSGDVSIFTDDQGYYQIYVYSGWSGTVTPEKEGYSFEPASIEYSNVVSNQTGEDYVGAILTYTISGTVTSGGSGLSGVVMGGLPSNPTTDASGNYSDTVDYGWSGTATPSKEGYSFELVSIEYSNVVSNQTGEDYVGTILTYTISGTVTSGGSGLSGVVMGGLPSNPTTDASGNYSDTVDYGWSGTATPSKEGYSFEPASIEYSNVVSNQTGEDYVGAILTYTISGTVTSGGSGLSGVVMGGLPSNPTTDASGNYSDTVEHGWSGTATLSLAGYIFEPTSIEYTNVSSDYVNQDYTAAIITLTISGSVKISDGTGIEGVLIGGLPGGPITDSSGNYSTTVDYGWSGTATPSKESYSFEPASIEYSNVVSNQTGEDYVGTILTYTISGTVTSGGSGLSGVVMGGLPSNPTTDVSGNYSDTVDYGWSGTATPSKEGYSFEPASIEYSNVVSNQTGEDYVGTILTYTISGTVTSGGSGLKDVTIIFSNGGGTATTGSNGSYSHSVSYGWSGMAKPSLAGYIFEPTSIEYNNVSSDYVNQDYTVTVITPTISGSVKTSDGTGIEGVLIGGLPEGPTTDSSGNYSTTVDYGWPGTVTPTKEGYTFSPTSRDYTNVTSDQSNQDYTGTLIQFTLTINAGTGGTTDPGPGTHTHDYGIQVSITAVPSSGYQFSGWSGDASGTSNMTTITMDSDKSVTASFSIIPPSTDDNDSYSVGGKKCFIATATYGSPLHPHVKTLRDFRDKYLVTNRIGRALVALYYKYSPSLADFVAKHRALRIIVRNQLVPLVIFSYTIVHLGSIVTAVILVFIFVLPFFFVWFYQRKMRIIQ